VEAQSENKTEEKRLDTGESHRVVEAQSVNKREEKRVDTGESYRVVEAQSENKTEEKRPGTDLPNSYKQYLRVEVLKTLCVILPVTFRSVINTSRSAW
jgi:hypothetical protein